MSSSTASQCIPIPPPINRHLFLSSGVAFCNRRDHTNGTEISRPSASTTRKLSSVQLTSTARGSTSTAKVLIPFLHKRFSVLLNNPLYFRQLSATETSRLHQRYRVEPKLGVSFSLLYMNVWRLVSFQAEEEKPVSFDSQDHRHNASLLWMLIAGKCNFKVARRTLRFRCCTRAERLCSHLHPQRSTSCIEGTPS